MNILFYCEDAVTDGAGGVQNVTEIWRKYLLNKGYNVFIIYKKNTTNDVPTGFQTELPYKSHRKSGKNVKFLKDYLTANGINIVINQAAQGPMASYVCIRACKKLNIPVISVVHNSPDALFRRFNLDITKPDNNIIKRLKSKLLLFLIQRMPQFGTRYLVNNSSRIIVLSPDYINLFNRLYSGRDLFKVIALPNPQPIEASSEKHFEKENIALFVGRLSQQKAVDQMLRLWKKIEQNDADAKLFIVGDGELRTYLENLASELELSNVSFEGFQNPVPYYELAKVFLMTSIFEGLPMTLLECQRYGVVPVVMDTFLAAKGILGENLSQFIIPPIDDDLFCSKVLKLLKNDSFYNEASSLCIQNVNRFSIDVIGPEFERIINECVSERIKS